MFNKRKIISIYILFILTIFLTSCTSIETLQGSQLTSIKDTLEYLTSEECDGRLPNTEGNKKAQEYIKDKFEIIGLEPYEDNYFFEYIHKGWNIQKEDYKMAITFLDGEIKNCEYGKDFLENIMTNVDFTGDLVLDYEDDDIENKFILLEDRDAILVGSKAKGIIYPMESFRRGVPNIDKDHMSMIQISPEIYKEIIDKGVEQIDLKFQVDGIEEEFPQNNVAGIIPGKNRENAIIITSHFDHVGSKDGMIWEGAIDNATGTSALIDIAEQLKKQADKKELDQDIIFCAFNGEESGFQGSTPFVQDLSTKYDNIYNINIDSVGLKNGGRLFVDGEGEDNELVNSIISQFEGHGIEAYSNEETPVGGDHIMFIGSGINGVGLSQENVDGIIHTLEDTIDKVDIRYLEEVSETLVDFIVNNSEKTFPLVKAVGNLDDIRSEELNNLKFNEYKYIEFKGARELIRPVIGFFVGSSLFDDEIHKDRGLKDFYDFYPGFLLWESLEDYDLQTINIYDVSEEYMDNPELDKIYTLETKIDNINKINFDYEDKLDNTMEEENNQVFSIGVVVDEKDEKPKVIYQEYTDNEISEENITIGNEIYNPVYKKSNNELRGLYKEVEHKDNIYKVMITVPYGNIEWPFKTIEESINIYKDLNLSPVIEDMLKSLMD